MQRPDRGSPGFSMIELLVVLVVLGVLAVIGVSMSGTSYSTSVRGVMDELEGTLAGAQARASATGQDVMIATSGDWASANPAILAYGNSTLGSATILANGLTDPAAFRAGVAGATLPREHVNAGAVTAANGTWFATAATGSTDITGVPPFNDAATGFQGILGTAASNLFQGGAGANTVLVSGTSHRFTSTFWIEVVALNGGGPVAGGPMGVLVVLANGATVYKFYNPGVRNGTGKWRKI